MKAPRRYFDPLAIGAPRPLLELPLRLERMIHFIPPHNEKVRAKAAELVGQVDVILGNLEDAIPIDAKEAAREGLIAMAKAIDFGSTGLWARVNALNSPWFIDDMTRLVGEIGDKLGRLRAHLFVVRRYEMDHALEPRGKLKQRARGPDRQRIEIPTGGFHEAGLVLGECGPWHRAISFSPQFAGRAEPQQAPSAFPSIGCPEIPPPYGPPDRPLVNVTSQ